MRSYGYRNTETRNESSCAPDSRLGDPRPRRLRDRAGRARAGGLRGPASRRRLRSGPDVFLRRLLPPLLRRRPLAPLALSRGATRAFVLALALCAPAPALAWGEAGHRM